jgi:multicomponent Na+:H+ antiporter subunit C
MEQALIFALTAAGLFGIGLYGILVQRHLLHKILSANIMGNGVFMLFIALARRNPLATDPLPHALVLTGIVISVSMTAFALALSRRLYGEINHSNPQRDAGIRGDLDDRKSFKRQIK